MVKIDLQLADKRRWAEIFNKRELTVSVPHDDPPEVGKSVRLDLIVGPAGPRVILRGEVISRKRAGQGAGFQLRLGRYEREKVSYLNGFVRGGLLDLRETRRLPIRLPVTYRGLGETRTGFTRDLNENGLFLVDEAPLPEDTDIDLEIVVPDRGEPISLVGKVCHTVVVEDEDVPGMGVRLDLNDEARAELKDIVDELERRFASGDLPVETLL